jgi:sialate O-acetylesterase
LRGKSVFMDNRNRIGWVLILTLYASAGDAQVRVPRLVSDGMVLQRDMPIRIWGWASAGEKVTVSFDGETAQAEAGDNGKWVATLGPRKAGGPYTMDINGINHIWLKNILVGEVWICTGGANMGLPMEKVKERYADLIAHADNPQIRQFRVGMLYDFRGPRDNVAPGGHWEAASAETIGSFSALSYLFARELYNYFHVPIGVIEASAGEAPAEAWLSAGALRFFPDLLTSAERYADSTFPEGKMPGDPMAPEGLFNGMIAPIATSTVRGILCYQGEANVPKAQDYQSLFLALITDWRQHWGMPALPFVYVQLGGYGPLKDQPEESQWAVLREAQRNALALPGTAMVVTADLDQEEGGPRDKAEVVRRMLLAAESLAYEKANIIYTGPLYHSMKVHGDRVHIEFDEINNGLIVRNGGEMHGFALAGEDNKFYPAKASIEGKIVVVQSDQVPHPMSVRYGWADNPAGINLFNRDILFKDGLPAPPFEGKARVRR